MRKRENCNVRGMSIRTKLMITMLLILGFTLCAFWMLNYALLPGYYQHKKVSMLVDSYNSVNTITQKDQPQLSKNGQLSDKSVREIDIMSANHSYSIYLFELTNFLGNIMYSFDYPSSDTISERKRRRGNMCSGWKGVAVLANVVIPKKRLRNPKIIQFIR